MTLAIAVVFAVVFVGGFYGFQNVQRATLKETVARPAVEPDKQVKDSGTEQEDVQDFISEVLGKDARERGSGKDSDGAAKRSPLEADVLFARSSPAVVQVITHDRQWRASGTGSGFLVGTQRLIATNYHVVAKAYSAHIVLPDKTKVAVVGVAAFDRDADLALLALVGQVDASPLELAEGGLPAVGAKVYAIGNPLGLANTLSDGLVSGHRQIDRITEIQTTAPISPGSSGGPLLAADGKVVDVTTATFRSGQNLNFAVPASSVAHLLLQWNAKKELTQFPLVQQPDTSVLIKSGFNWMKQQDYDKAIKDFNAAIQLDPRSALAYCNRGLAWHAKKDYDQAISDFNDAIRLAPDDAHRYCYRGHSWEKKKHYEKAIADYSTAIRLDPSVADFYFNRGHAWEGKKGYDEAIRDYTAAIRLNPNEAFYYFLRGSVWSDKGEYDKAISDYDEAIRLDPNVASYYSFRGNAWYAKKDYAKAKKDRDEARRLDPK
ncbi:tetratricopeptide repeat protein [Gemmata sp. G18]|uniref:Tetratricopeptide repeat protein n=1 Tax=Gemmata palustris TaxID=2822762 RepID=A0ABS5C0L3_9BACT|nr:tetratricopeptide repeat protein [Gemmata palustris]MBP3959530.1 tetratricopeptide repeat protein [Gemmata palustris]